MSEPIPGDSAFVEPEEVQRRVAAGRRRHYARLPEPWERAHLTWLEAVTAKGTPLATKRAYGEAARRFAQWANVPGPRQATREKFIEYQREVQTRGYSVETVHLYLRGVRRFFEWLVESGDLLADPTEGVKFAPRPQHVVPDVLTEEQLNALLAAPPETPRGTRDRAILEVICATGMRAGRLMALNVGDVERLNLSEPAASWVTRYVEGVRPEWAKDDALWVGPRGRRLSIEQWGQLLRAYAVGCGFGATIQTIRRTIAVRMLRSGAAPREILKFLGRVDLSMLARFLRMTPAQLRARS